MLTNIEPELLADLSADRARYSGDGGYWGGLDDRYGLQVDCTGTRTEIFTQRVGQNLVNIDEICGLNVDILVHFTVFFLWYVVKMQDGLWNIKGLRKSLKKINKNKMWFILYLYSKIKKKDPAWKKFYKTLIFLCLKDEY